MAADHSRLILSTSSSSGRTGHQKKVNKRPAVERRPNLGTSGNRSSGRTSVRFTKTTTWMRATSGRILKIRHMVNCETVRGRPRPTGKPKNLTRQFAMRYEILLLTHKHRR